MVVKFMEYDVVFECMSIDLTTAVCANNICIQ